MGEGSGMTPWPVLSTGRMAPLVITGEEAAGYRTPRV